MRKLTKRENQRAVKIYNTCELLEAFFKSPDNRRKIYKNALAVANGEKEIDIFNNKRYGTKLSFSTDDVCCWLLDDWPEEMPITNEMVMDQGDGALLIENELVNIELEVKHSIGEVTFKRSGDTPLTIYLHGGHYESLNEQSSTRFSTTSLSEFIKSIERAVN